MLSLSTSPNDAIQIVYKVYMEVFLRNGKVPEFYEINDALIEYVIDYDIKSVTFFERAVSAIGFFDTNLREVLVMAGLSFKMSSRIIDPMQITLFDDLED